MTQYIKNGGAWVPIKKEWVKDAGVWKPVQKKWVKDAGVWKLIFSGRPILIGTQELTGTQADTAGTLTIPADCTFIVATHSATYGNNTASLNSFYLLQSGTYYDFNIASAYGQWSLRVSNVIGYYQNPPTGTVTLSANISGAAGQGSQVTVYYFKNVNTTSPIGSVSTTGSNGAATRTITITPQSTFPFIVACMGSMTYASSSSATNLTIAQYDYTADGSFLGAYNDSSTDVSTSYTLGFNSSNYCRMALVEILPP